MMVEIEGEQFDINKDNSVIMRYGVHDILDGLYVDRGDDYIYMSKYGTAYKQLMHGFAAEHIRVEFTFSDFDHTEIPHCWVIASVGRMIVNEAEEITENP